MSLDPNFLIIAKYVNAGADLAEALQADLRSRRISDATIIALSRFKDAADSAAKLLDPVMEENKKLN